MNKAVEQAQFDDDEYDEELWQKIREEGRMVACHQWDSGNPGSGAGANRIYFYSGQFYVEDDDANSGAYATFKEAEEATVSSRPTPRRASGSIRSSNDGRKRGSRGPSRPAP
jgi:hypothetical protein